MLNLIERALALQALHQVDELLQKVTMDISELWWISVGYSFLCLGGLVIWSSCSNKKKQWDRKLAGIFLVLSIFLPWWGWYMFRVQRNEVETIRQDLIHRLSGPTQEQMILMRMQFLLLDVFSSSLGSNSTLSTS